MNRPAKVVPNSNFSFWPTDVSVPALIKSSSSSSSDSLDPATKKPPAASFKPHKLLYPMKSRHDLGSTKKRASEQADDLLPQTKWVGLTPLDMVQNIVSLAEKSPEFSAEIRASSLRNFLTSHESRSSKARAGDKRKSDHVEDETLDTDEEGDGLAEALVASHGNLQLPGSGSYSWKPSDTFGATEQVTRLDSLANDLERLVVADPKKRWCIHSYNRVQQACVSQVSDVDTGKDVALELAMTRATSQMQALVEMVSVEEPKVKTTPRLSTANTLLALERPITTRVKCQRSNAGFLQHCPQPAYRPTVQNSKERKDAFQACMVAWLKHNFANPFPDENMLNRLATYMVLQVRCITVNTNDTGILEGNSSAEYHRNMVNIAIEKVSTWLVNNRSRSWRPVSFHF